MQDVTILRLPYPPSVNHYWRRVGNRTLISRQGRDYREQVALLVGSRRQSPLSGRLSVSILASVPDRRRRDLDNLPKAVLDALGHAGIYEDDSQIDDLRIRRGKVRAGGRLTVLIAQRRSRWAWWRRWRSCGLLSGLLSGLAVFSAVFLVGWWA